MNAFASYYQAEFRPTEQEIRLDGLAERYIAETEAFDRQVCTGPVGRDGIMPASPRELALSSRNAWEVLGDICRSNPDISRAVLTRAIVIRDRRGPRP
jgi:hypothetical protein